MIFSILNPTPKTIILKKNTYITSLKPITKIYQQKTQTSINIKQNNHKLLTTNLPNHLNPLISNISNKLSTNKKNKLKQILIQYSNIFIKPNKQINQTNLIHHKIKLQNQTPIKIPTKQLPIHQQKITNKKINKILNQNIIKPNKSP